ncbi:MAG: S8 family peptidase [Bdellovibrionales bacterium]
MKKIKQIVLTPVILGSVFFSTLTIVGCSKESAQPERRMISAPQSENQTGYVIDLSDDAENPEKIEATVTALEAKGGRIRSINPRHGLFEVYGLSTEEIGEKVPHSQFHKNVFTRKKQQQPTIRIQNYCHRIPTAPQMTLQAEVGGSPLLPEDPVLMNRRNTKGFSAHVQFTGVQPEYSWTVFAPMTSVQLKRKITGPLVQFLPDELGEYEVYLVVKLSETHACIRNFMFGVTENQPFTGATTARPLPEMDRLAQFPHLNSLGLGNAWKFASGYNVKIAVLDTGMDYNHPDLSANVDVKTAELANGRDDDGNTFIDDNIGWDFVNNDNMPYDDDMHGTHVAGLSGSYVGVAPAAKLLPVKVLGPFGGDMASLAGAIYYAVDSKARIINMSLGGNEPVPSLEKAIAYAAQKGVLVVVAAGNDSVDIDLKPTYPASYVSPTLITVAATDLMGNLTTYTNVGRTHVAIAAPGGSEADGGLISLLYKNRYNKKYIPLSGTSMATPIISGAAALLISVKPTLTASQVKALLLSSGTMRTDYGGKISSQKFVNINAALQTLRAPRLIPPLD